MDFICKETGLLCSNAGFDGKCYAESCVRRNDTYLDELDLFDMLDEDEEE